MFNLLASLLTVALATSLPMRQGPVDGLQEIQGTWKIVKAESDGREVQGKDVANARIIFSGKRCLLFQDGKTQDYGEVAVSADKEPKWIDVQVAFGINEGKACLGIYEVEGQTMKVCQRPPGEDRPKEFQSRPLATLLYLEKESPKAK